MKILVNHNTQNELKMNRIMKTTVAIICALIILGGCGKWPKDDELTLTRKPFLGDELCTDGYYYYRWKNDTSTFNILFLYKNGVVLALPNSLSTNELPEWEESFRNGEFLTLTAFFSKFC